MNRSEVKQTIASWMKGNPGDPGVYFEDVRNPDQKNTRGGTVVFYGPFKDRRVASYFGAYIQDADRYGVGKTHGSTSDYDRGDIALLLDPLERADALGWDESLKVEFKHPLKVPIDPKWVRKSSGTPYDPIGYALVRGFMLDDMAEEGWIRKSSLEKQAIHKFVVLAKFQDKSTEVLTKEFQDHEDRWKGLKKKINQLEDKHSKIENELISEYKSLRRQMEREEDPDKKSELKLEFQSAKREYERKQHDHRGELKPLQEEYRDNVQEAQLRSKEIEKRQLSQKNSDQLMHRLVPNPDDKGGPKIKLETLMRKDPKAGKKELAKIQKKQARSYYEDHEFNMHDPDSLNKEVRSLEKDVKFWGDLLKKYPKGGDVPKHGEMSAKELKEEFEAARKELLPLKKEQDTLKKNLAKFEDWAKGQKWTNPDRRPGAKKEISWSYYQEVADDREIASQRAKWFKRNKTATDVLVHKVAQRYRLAQRYQRWGDE